MVLPSIVVVDVVEACYSNIDWFDKTTPYHTWEELELLYCTVSSHILFVPSLLVERVVSPIGSCDHYSNPILVVRTQDNKRIPVCTPVNFYSRQEWTVGYSVLSLELK